MSSIRFAFFLRDSVDSLSKSISSSHFTAHIDTLPSGYLSGTLNNVQADNFEYPS